MKLWMLFVVITILCWGSYVPMIHHGQLAFGSKNAALRAFLFVGVAYVIVAGTVLVYVVISKSEPLDITRGGATISTLAGILGAVGALGIVFATKNGGQPLIVAPLVFAGAPIINTLVSMLWDKPAKPPGALFFLGIVIAALGMTMVLRFRPIAHRPAPVEAVHTLPDVESPQGGADA